MPVPRSTPTPRVRRPRTPRLPAGVQVLAGETSRAVTYDDRPWLASYPAGVPSDPDVPLVPLTRLLDDATSTYPEHVALAFLGVRTTYRELSRQVELFARVLADLGVGKGDRVALVLPNCPQNVVAVFAALRLGAVVVEHNPLYTEAELRHQLADCGATVVVCLDRVHAAVAQVQPDTAVRKVVVTSILDALPRRKRLLLNLPLGSAGRRKAQLSAEVPPGTLRWAALMKRAATGSSAPVAVIDPMTDLALLQYTGGTTGLSRGAMLTHHNLVSNTWMNRIWDTEARPGREVTLGVLPLFHAYGLTVAMTSTILLGGTLVLLPRFDLDEVFAAIDRWGPTLLPGVPPIYKALADSPKVKDHDLSSIRLCVSGAMRLSPEVAEQFRAVSGATLVEGYGLTETSPSTHANPTTGPGRPGSIGLPLPGTLCRVVDQQNPSRQVPVGEPGELVIKGPQVFAGYWGHADQAGVFTADGYLLTGDVAVMDDDGWFRIVDRKKEMIIAGGFNIYPSEVEAVLNTLAGVADVAVVGVPDRYRGETVTAFVVRAPGARLSEQDVVEHAAASLTAYKVPKVVEFVDVLPRSAVGKVLRRALAQRGGAATEADLAPAPAARARRAPVTKAPVTKAPLRKAPVTKASLRKAPLRKAPLRKAPAKAPLVKAPVTKAPVTKAPATKAPATKAPAQVSAAKAPAKPRTPRP